MSDFDHAIQEARRLAQTPEGKQLAQLMQQLGDQSLQKTIDSAASGDFTQAQKMLSALMQDPKARELLQKLGGSHGK